MVEIVFIYFLLVSSSLPLSTFIYISEICIPVIFTCVKLGDKTVLRHTGLGQTLYYFRDQNKDSSLKQAPLVLPVSTVDEPGTATVYVLCYTLKPFSRTISNYLWHFVRLKALIKRTDGVMVNVKNA